MNFATLAGFSAALIVFFASSFWALENPSILMDYHALLLVLGGTIAASLICFPLKRIVALLRVFFRRMFGKSKRDFSKLIDDVVELAIRAEKGGAQFRTHTETLEDPFLKDAATLLFWVREQISVEEYRDLLETRATTHFEQYHSEAKIFRVLSKFPPAFGLLGTSIGMIAVLQGLGSAGGKEQIGPSMSIALVATIYGLTFSNFFLIPIAENLTDQSKEDSIARCMVVEGMMLIVNKSHPIYIREKLNSYLLPGSRQQKEITKNSSSNKAA